MDRKACAKAAKGIGWEKLFVVRPLQLESSENMLAELFKVRPALVRDPQTSRAMMSLTMIQIEEQSIMPDTGWRGTPSYCISMIDHAMTCF